MRAPLAALTLLLSAGCATPPYADDDVPALLLGEQHDARQHQQLHHDVIQALAVRGRLAAVVIEMAEHGRSTAPLPPGASEAEVKQALRWNDAAWPWQAYGPAVMAAVRSGAPVIGGNLPRADMQQVMLDTRMDRLPPEGLLQAQQQAVRSGHCGLLPEAQILPMTRVQIARDRAMAQVLAGSIVPGKTVVLLAGAGHVDPQLGVPRHLPRELRARPVMLPVEATGKDYCAQLRERYPPRR